jgi:hypothetical protein
LTGSFNLSRATTRSEEKMAINHIQNAITAANSIGKGIVNVVRGCLAASLCAASFAEAIESSGLFMSRGYWWALSLKRTPATMTPMPATCRAIADRRHQRHQRWMSGVVVVDPGTVGVC